MFQCYLAALYILRATNTAKLPTANPIDKAPSLDSQNCFNKLIAGCGGSSSQGPSIGEPSTTVSSGEFGTCCVCSKKSENQLPWKQT